MASKKPPDADTVRIGRRIRELRGDLSHRQFAKIVGLSDVALIYYERAQMKPKFETLKQIADRCNKDIGFFYPSLESPALRVVAEAATRYSLGRSRNKTVSIVRVINFVPAGDGSIDDVPTDDKFEIPFDVPDKLFALRVTGESMDPEYRDGDYVFVEPVAQHAIRNNRDYALILEDSTTLKRVRKHPQGFELISLNNEYNKPWIVSEIRRAFIVRGVFRYF